MTNPAHLLSVAALLLVGFLIGAVIGTLVRLLVLRLQHKPVIPVAAVRRVTGKPLAEASVAPPTIAAAPVVAAAADVPLSEPAEAATPAPTVPDFTATLLALASEPPPQAFVEATRQRAEATSKPPPELRAVTAEDAPTNQPAKAALAGMQPARAAGETTSGRPVAAPRHENLPAPAASPAEQRSAEVIPFPTVALEIASERLADTAIAMEAVAMPGPVVEAAVMEHPGDPVPADFEPVTIAADAEPAPNDVLDILFATADSSLEPATAAIAVSGADVAAASAPMVEAAIEVPAAILEGPSAVSMSPASPEPVTVSLDDPVDEDAAMRAIEGNWTPRRPPPRPTRPPAPPEGANDAVAAAARAVASARRTAEAVVAEAAAEVGRPVGLDAPRDGTKDELSHIIGVLPVIETALNKLGLYHFDQLAALSDDNVRWIENHLGVPGRISRELWREQARELSAVLKPRRAAEN